MCNILGRFYMKKYIFATKIMVLKCFFFQKKKDRIMNLSHKSHLFLKRYHVFSLSAVPSRNTVDFMAPTLASIITCSPLVAAKVNGWLIPLQCSTYCGPNSVASFHSLSQCVFHYVIWKSNHFMGIVSRSQIQSHQQ